MKTRTRILAWLLISSGFAAAAFAAGTEPVRRGVAAAEPVVRTSIGTLDGMPAAAAPAEFPLLRYPQVASAESQAATAAGTSVSQQAVVSNLGFIQWVWFTSFSSSIIDEYRYYYIDLPAGANQFVIGMTSPVAPADIDLYVRYGAKPDSSHWDCRPNLSAGVNELCDFTGKIRAGRWWFALRTAAPYAGAGMTTWCLTSLGVAFQPWDFNAGTAGVSGDAMTDIVWHNTTTGANAVWLLNTAGAVIGSAYLPSIDANTKVVGAGDFNGDGIPDVVVRNSVTGANTVLFLNGPGLTGSTALDSVPDPNWQIVSVADMNSDGMPDIVWRNSSTGANAVWLMNGTTTASSVYLPAVADLNWHIVGVVDFNLDSKPDLVWRNISTGVNAVWYMNDTAVIGSAYLPGMKSGLWDVAGVGDIDGNGTPDLIWRDGATGTNAVWFLDNTLTNIGSVYLPSLPTDWIMTGPR